MYFAQFRFAQKGVGTFCEKFAEKVMETVYAVSRI
jgi:hypothetical protein